MSKTYFNNDAEALKDAHTKSMKAFEKLKDLGYTYDEDDKQWYLSPSLRAINEYKRQMKEGDKNE